MATRRQHIRNSRAVLEAGTPLEAEYPFDQTLKAIRAGDGSTLGGFLQKRWGYAHPIAPVQIVADQNNYNPADLAIAEVLDLTSDAKRSITGLAGGGTGRRLTVRNRGSFDITLVNASASSTAANRFAFERDLVLRPQGAVELQYSAADSRWMRAGGNEKLAYITEELLLTGVISPAQITASQNDYAPSGLMLASTLRLSSDASRNVTGLVDPRDGVIKTIVNVGTNPIVLKNADAGSTAANRFDFGADVTLAGKQAATLRYDGSDARWKLLAATAGASVAAGAVTAQTLAASALGLSMINGKLAASVAGNALTVAIKTFAGSDPSVADPVLVTFRDPTASSGDYTVIAVTAATSLTISAGSSLGVSGGSVAFRLWIVGFNDAGTFRLAAINCFDGIASIYPLAGWNIGSAVAEGGAGAADSALTFYASSTITDKPYSTLGYLTWEGGLGAPGTWASGPSRIHLQGSRDPLPGMQVQFRRENFSSLINYSTSIPVDDTVPQNTEGTEIMTRGIQPTSAANIALVRAQAIVAHNASDAKHTIALFRDSAASAIVATAAFAATAPQMPMTIPIEQMLVFGSTGYTIFRVRAGASTTTSSSFNGVSSARIFGGVASSFLSIEELMG
ncbi:hypothetical protein LOC51_19835 [Rubrivivax sp. JA1024]|nr:hypothetical protein [Rubrivivax sp. JA1024]